MTRREAINIVQGARQYLTAGNPIWDAEKVDEAMKMAIDALLERPQGEWIPCSERLPSKDGFYIATCDGEICGEEQPFTGFAEFENRKWVDDEDDYQCVLAWMPLPEPYKGGDDK